MAVQSTPIIGVVFLKFLNLPNFKDFFIDFFGKNGLRVVSDLNFFWPGLKMNTIFVNYAAKAIF